MGERRHNVVDRRAGNDRRKAYKLGYALQGGTERRDGKDRRVQWERRKDWMWVDGCCSVYVGDLT